MSSVLNDFDVISKESSKDLFLDLIGQLSSHWNGRRITLQDAISLHSSIQDTIVQFVFSQDTIHTSCEKILSRLTKDSANEPFFSLAHRNTAHLYIPSIESQHDLILPAGLGKFWKKHKKEIIIGAIAVAVIVTVIAITIATHGTGSTAAASAGTAAIGGAQMALQDADKDPPNVTNHLSQDSTSHEVAKPSPPYSDSVTSDPLFLKEGVLLDGQYYSYSEFLWKTNQEEFFANLLNLPTSTTESKSSSPCIPKDTPRPRMPPQHGSSLFGKFFEELGRELAGPELMENVPATNLQRSHLFTTKETTPSSCRIGGINGMNTSLNGAIDHANYIGDFTHGKSVDWVYNNSHGALADLFVEIPVNYAGKSPNTAKLLTDNWVTFHEENKSNPKAKYLQLCHSQGTIHVKNALASAPQEIRDRVIVIAIAPATVIPRDLCFRATNYASKRDIVHFGELIFAGFNEPEIKKELLPKALENHRQLILLDPHEEATGMDHDFQSPTFRRVIQGRIDDYINSNGEYE